MIPSLKRMLRLFGVESPDNDNEEKEMVRSEIAQQSMKNLKLSSITDKQARQVMVRLLFMITFDELVISPSSNRKEEERIWKLDQESMETRLPQHVEQLMANVSLISSLDKTDSNSIRPRLDSILLSLLCIARKNYKLSVGSSSDDRQIFRAPYWESNATLTTADEYLSWQMETTVDYILWYGPSSYYDTNLVVIRSSGMMDALLAMVMIHKARKAKNYKGGVYGISTDSHNWNFLHLCDSAYVSKRCLLWSDDQQEIIGQVYKILKQAFILLRERQKDPEVIERMLQEPW